MPVKVSEEMREKVFKIISDNPGIKRDDVIKLSGMKLWYVSAALGELQDTGDIFRQTKMGKAYYFTMEYAKANKTPKNITAKKRDSSYVPPARDVPMLENQRYLDSLFQVAR